MEALQSSEQRFARLSAYPYAASWLALEGDRLRMAYVIEGAHDSVPVLLLHGPPTWSYLWRRVIPTLVEGGCRVVAPDLIGFGRSDKVARPRDHRIDRHAAWLAALVEAVDLREAALVAHGAAVPLALRLAVGPAGDRFTHLVAVSPLSAAPGSDEELPVGELVARACAAPIGDAARAAYDAPFAEPEHGAGLRALASFLAGGIDQPLELALAAVHGERDELADRDWPGELAGAPDRRHRIAIAGAGHYVPEERGPELALALLALLSGA